ncbi:2Fe-2S iron-sulfur cluster-binding protein [Streptomyces sp. NPDC015131]|uniref:2Fe-2S iron-sulfur cluster-binding protein n=1 Tax=Streptomyces sp. NPDC015131 TaxID=3364941 RepID=UPI0036F81008
MTTDENDDRREGAGWQPTPPGEYDGDATAFVQLPPDLSGTGAPLEAPGHGYVPPEAWAGHDPNATAQWEYRAPAPAPTELTGQWTVPVAQGDLPDESGEFTTSALASQWTSGNPPATLPGGAPAPWATPAPPPAPAEDTAPEPVHAEPAPEPVPAEPGAPAGPDPEPAEPVRAEPGAAPEAVHAEPVPAPEPGEPGAAHEPGAAEEPGAPAPAHVTAGDEHPHISYVLRVNGTDRPVTDAWIGESLLYVLRERLGLAGAKDGCSQGECGACNVQVDGRLVASCLVPAATTAGSEVRTVEGLATDGEPSDVQRALARCGAVQCGFCIPGMAMTVHDLLEGNHAPSERETRQALCGNLCRCTGYRGVLDAVRDVVAERAAAAEAAGAADAPDAPAPGQGGAAQARIPHQIPHPHDGGTA